MSLSRENYDKLDKNFLYKKEPIIDNSFYVGTTSGTYHCKNWTFRVAKYDDGRAYMRDTYFNDNGIEITDENINDYKFVFDFREVKQLRDSEANEYNEDNLYHVATDSGGYSCGGCYWVNKNIEKSKDLQIAKKQREIESIKNNLEWAERDLKRLLGE